MDGDRPPVVSDPRVTFGQLIATYALRIDAGDFDGVADLLADAELSFDGHDLVCRGRQEILAMYTASTRRYEDGTPRTKHVVSNVIAEVDPEADTGSSRSYFTVLQAVPGQLSLQPVIAGRYAHRFAMQGGSWRITSMRIAVDLVGELGHHLLFAL